MWLWLISASLFVRQKELYIALVSEFLATFLFLMVIYCILLNAKAYGIINATSMLASPVINSMYYSSKDLEKFFDNIVEATSSLQVVMIVSIGAGIIVTLLVILFGSLSGAHLNPLVTIAFVLVKKFPIVQGKSRDLYVPSVSDTRIFV
jgi:glycerol uptake facilitator-like aquaporin